MERKVNTSYLTFDIDFTDYFSGELFDEFEQCFEELNDCLRQFSSIKTTWFIRIDSQIEKVYGKGDHFFKLHQKRIDYLREQGHEIGWHHHSYKLQNGKWIQDVDEKIICEDLKKYGELALRHRINISRMGWGFHTNSTMKVLDDMGFYLDSSAIPRPQYKWELSKKDWSMTGQLSYHPSLKNYQVQNANNLKLTQVPINTIVLPLPNDTEPKVMRYLNPAYKHSIFINSVNDFFKTYNDLVLVCHPYEILQSHKVKHDLLSFSKEEFIQNLDFLKCSDIISKAVKTNHEKQ
jgi:hypothetical protein